MKTKVTGEKKLIKWKIIVIDWIDSMHDSGWKHEDNVDLDDKYLYKKSVGFFYQESKEAITIVQSKDDDGEEKQNIDAVMTIPKVAIKKITSI